MLNRAYSVIDIKSVDDEHRLIKGIASTPTPDRLGDVVDPMGAVFKAPMPLLLDHDNTQQVGHVEFARPTKGGIPFEARIQRVDEPGQVKDLVDKAWHLAKYKLRQFVSIGFRPLKDGVEVLKEGGLNFKSWEWLELSLVSIPAQPEAVITQLKSIDAGLLAETTRAQRVYSENTKSNPGASGKSKNPKEPKMSTISERIPALEAKRAAIVARLEAIQAKADAEGRTKDEKEGDEFDTAYADIESVDKELVDANRLEKLKAITAKPVIGTTEAAGSASRGGLQVRTPNLPKGTQFVRAVQAIAVGKGSQSDALAFAKQWESSTPEVVSLIKVLNTGDGSGVTSSADDAGGELVYPALIAEFLDLLMPQTILGRVQGFDRVPFNVRVNGMDGGSTVNWVGEGGVKPVSDPSFFFTTLPYHKIAGIVVLTNELVRLSTPSAEEKVRTDLVRQISKFIDQQFLDPNITATDNRPASITNGVAGFAASGTTADDLYFDLHQALGTFGAAENVNETIHIVMPFSNALGIAGLRNALGQFEFPQMSFTGGTLLGFRVLVSNNVPAGQIVMFSARDILLADDGRVRLDASREATLDLAGGGTPNYSLFQRNSVAILAEQFITWKKSRASAVTRITDAGYAPQPSS